MELATLQTILTVTALIAFLGIMFWAFSPARKDSFIEASNLPFDGEVQTVKQQENVTENNE